MRQILIFIFLSLLAFSGRTQSSSLDSLRLVLPIGHNLAWCNDVVYNSNHSKLYSVGVDKKMIIWDVNSGKELITCHGHTDWIECIDISSNDLKIATGSRDKTVRIWDANDGSLLKILQGHSESIDKVFFLKRNKNRVISVSNNRGNHEVFLWDIKKGEILFKFNGSITAINNKEDLIFIDANSESIFSDDEYKRPIVKSYSLITGQKVNNYKIDKSIKVNSITIDESNNLLMAAGCNAMPLVWDIESAKIVNSVRGDNCDFYSCELSPDNNYILTINRTDKAPFKDFAIRLWSAISGKLLYYDIDSSTHLMSTFFSSDGKYMVLHRSTGYRLPGGKSEAIIKIISMENFEKTSEIIVYDKFDWSSLINLHNNKFFSFIGDNEVNLYEFKTGKLVNKIKPKGAALQATINSKSSGFNKNLSNLENYIGGSINMEFSLGYDFILNISEPHLVSFLQNKLIRLSHYGKNGFLLTDNSIIEVQIPELNVVNNAKIEIANGLFNEKFLTNLQLSEKYLFVEYNDSIHIYNRSENVLIKKLAGQNLTLSNNYDIIGFTSASTGYSSNTLVYKINTEDTLFFNKNNTCVQEICFGPNSNYFLTQSSYGAYDSESLLYDLNNNCIIDTISNFTPKAGFTRNGNLILHEQWMHHENRNNLKTVIRDFNNHEDIGELEGINPQADWTNEYYSTISNDTIRIYRIDDFSYVKSLIGHEDDVRNVVFNSKLNKLVSSGSDNQIIIWDFEKGKEIYRLFILQNNNWLVKLPNSAYYMCSKNASKMLHYVTPSLKVIGFDQLDPVYNRPDIVLDSIGKYFDGVDRGMIDFYKKAWEKRIDRLGLDKEKLGKGEISVPNAEFVGAEDIADENTSGQLELKVEAKDPKYTLRRFNILVNEVPLYGSEGISIASRGLMEWNTTVSIPLSVEENKIQVSVMNELGLENFKYPTYVNYTPPANHEIVSKTYFIGIGVDEFEEAGHNLSYCVKDIEDLSNAFKSSSNTESIVLTNEKVTKENILALKNTLKNTSVHDKVIISCSSHGLLDDEKRFYLATHDVDFSHPEHKGLPYAELEGLLDSIPARQKLLMLDACNSGENEIEQRKRPIATTANTNNVNEGKTRGEILEEAEEEFQSSFETMMELFVNVSNETGSVIITAAGGKQSALEGEAVKIDGKKIENGAFTYSVLEYLKKTDKTLTVNGLKSYVEKRVEEITGGKQRPTSRQETMEVDWDLR